MHDSAAGMIAGGGAPSAGAMPSAIRWTPPADSVSGARALKSGTSKHRVQAKKIKHRVPNRKAAVRSRIAKCVAPRIDGRRPM